MSDTAKDVKLSLKVMINKKKTKVLFAEANNDFADVLISFLTLPLGRIVKLLEKHYGDKSPVFGSITSLYKGLENLDDIHFSTYVAKLMLLDPKSSLDSICRNLKLDISNSTPIKYFICDQLGYSYSCPNFNKNIGVCMYYGGASRCDCGRPLNTGICVESTQNGGAFTKKNASFLISEDLRMVPYSAGFLQNLSSLGVTGAEGAELRNIPIGTDEIMDLLKCCLLSKTPLTDFILNKGEIVSLPAKPEPGNFLHKILKEETSNSITLKVMVQKSTNKLLFAQAGYDFVELLFSFLFIPIGGFESLLDTNTPIKNLDNLYRSISDVILDDHFLTLDTKKRLMNPSIPHFYKPKNTLLPLDEESAPAVYYSCTFDYLTGKNKHTLSHISTGHQSSRLTSIKSPRADENYVIGPATFMVTDDLTVTPFCMSASFSILNRLNIPFSDVDELEVHIGLQEGLSILKASVPSTCALSNGLFNHIMIRKQPKQEQ